MKIFLIEVENKMKFFLSVFKKKKRNKKEEKRKRKIKKEIV